MSLLSLIRRFVFFLCVAALPFAALGAALGGRRGLVVGVGLLFSASLLALSQAENGIRRIYRARRETPEGLQRSLDRVLARLGGAAPRLQCFSEPAPQVLVARSLGSRGTIFLSEGLVGSLTEEELRALLLMGVLRVRARGIRFKSLCAWLAHLTLELAPRAWVELLFGELRWHEDLGALSALRFAAVFSAAKFFVNLGRGPAVDAPHSLTRLPAVSGEVSNPGSGILHFSDPWASRALFRL